MQLNLIPQLLDERPRVTEPPPSHVGEGPGLTQEQAAWVLGPIGTLRILNQQECPRKVGGVG